MDFLDLVKKTRSYRRFDQNHTIPQETIRHLVECARLTASGANMQPLKYIATCTSQANASVFETLAWAAALPDWPGPPDGERPSAYVVICTDSSVRESAGADMGIAAQTILLAATDAGLGGCMLGSVQRPELRETLGIPEQLTISLVVALGKPVEVVELETAQPGEPTTYYRDAAQVHHVPKRGLEEVLLEIR